MTPRRAEARLADGERNMKKEDSRRLPAVYQKNPICLFG